MTTYIGTTGTASIPQIEVYTGSAWQTPYGLTQVANVIFTSTATIQINNVFTSTYDQYVFEMRYLQNTSNANVNLQNSLAGTPASTASYGGNGFATFANGLSAVFLTTGAGGTTGTKLQFATGAVGSWQYVRGNISGVSTAAPTLYFTNFFGQNTGAGGNSAAFVGGTHTPSTAYDGLTITAEAGTMTGYIKIYGIRNS